MFLNNLKVVLVKPQLPENIGGLARVILNFNISNLAIVNPKKVDFFAQAQKASCGALDILNPKVYNSIEEATQDCTIVLALSARNRNITIPFEDIREVLPQLNKKYDLSNVKMAVLLGCEKSGLSNGDICNANIIVNIATNEDFQSLNIAQATGIFCYEYNYYMKKNTLNIPQNSKEKPHDIATKKEVDYYFNYLFQKLEYKNYFTNDDKKQITTNNIKSIYQKSILTSQEVHTLMGITKMLCGKDN